MWLWEDEYQDYLENDCEAMKDHRVDSSPMKKTYVVEGKGGWTRKRKNESNGVERQLGEIIWLLKTVICALGLLVALMFLYVVKH